MVADNQLCEKYPHMFLLASKTRSIDKTKVHHSDHTRQLSEEGSKTQSLKKNFSKNAEARNFAAKSASKRPS
jgi:hypothetical protein